VKVLALHSRYRTRAGEDESFDTEVALLRDRGHQVVELVRHGAALVDRGPLARGAAAVWNAEAARAVEAAVEADHPDVAYVNNVFPGLTASVLRALDRAGVPVLLAVRNYRLACVRGVLFRDGRRCVDCVGRRLALPGVAHGCYADSRPASAAATAAQLATRAALPAGARYAAVSEHVRGFLVRLGVPADRVEVKPNTVAAVPAPAGPEPYLLFVGRLQPEKGVRVALDAVAAVPGARLVVVGSGPMADEVRGSARVELLGERPHAEVLALMARATATLVPSRWDEPFGRVAMESLACGTPVVVSDRGGLPEIPDPSCGLVVDPEDGPAMAAAVASVVAGGRWAGSARLAARERFAARFSPAAVGQNLERLLAAAAQPGRRSAMAPNARP
jgi:glycosyltransferase involved in cell wall biosynthesis